MERSLREVGASAVTHCGRVASGRVLLPVVCVAVLCATQPLAAEDCLPVTVTADSTLSGYPAYNILDGNATDSASRWASAKTTVPHWVRFEFGSPQVMDRVVIYGQPDPYAILDAELQVWEDGAWVPIWSAVDSNQALLEATFAARTVSDIRLYITKACQAVTPYGYAARLYEIEFYSGASRVPARAAELFSPAPSRPTPPEPPVDEAVLLASVRPFPADLLGSPSSAAAAKMQTYYESVLSWNQILLDRFQAVPCHPEWGYYGLGGNVENELRPITYAVMVNAFLAEAELPGSGADADRRARCRADAVAALRYLVQGHVSGTGACLNGRYWGNAWQSALWTRAAGMGAWMLWPKLDSSLQVSVARMVEWEADRFLHTSPKSSEYGDTGAEENAWNSQIVTLACNMMPGHPRAAQWAQTARLYMYNTLSVVADEADTSIGDDGRTVADWVQTVNVHPDYSIENHGIVHVGYLKNSLAILKESVLHYRLAGAPVPLAGAHHFSDCYGLLKRCMAWDASPLYFSGNDWKLVHTQDADVCIYAIQSCTEQDRSAAYLESVALDYLVRIQQSQGGYYNVRRDLEYGGLCATRLVCCYLVHAALGEGAVPWTESEFEASINGVTYLAYAQAILHRTSSRFASFSWGHKRMGLSLPRDGNWDSWPHFASYIGQIEGSDASGDPLSSVTWDAQTERFSVAGRLERAGGKATQSFAFASLARPITVYMERLTLASGAVLTSRETGIIGHEYPLAANERTIYTQGQETVVTGFGNEPQTITWDGDWLNLGGRVGYVVRRSGGIANRIRYHDLREGSGTVPALQEWFSLIGEAEPARLPTESWACVVTFLNQSAADTGIWAAHVNLDVTGEIATCHIGEHAVTVDFGSMRVQIDEAVPDQVPGDSDGDTDVDQEDFGHLQVCMSGSFHLPAVGCEDADLDRDGDVDGNDVAVFIRCVTGADMPGDRFCAE